MADALTSVRGEMSVEVDWQIERPPMLIQPVDQSDKEPTGRSMPPTRATRVLIHVVPSWQSSRRSHHQLVGSGEGRSLLADRHGRQRACRFDGLPNCEIENIAVDVQRRDIARSWIDGDVAQRRAPRLKGED